MGWIPLPASLTGKLEKFNTVSRVPLHVSPKSNLGPRSDRLKALLASMFLLGFPSIPFGGLCRTEWSGWGLGSSVDLQTRKCSGQMLLIYVLTGRHSAFGCQCLITGGVHIKIWFPTYLENWNSSCAGLHSHLATIAPVTKDCPPDLAPCSQLATTPVALYPTSTSSQHPLGDVRVLLPAWTFHACITRYRFGTGKCLLYFLEGTKPQRVTGQLCPDPNKTLKGCSPGEGSCLRENPCPRDEMPLHWRMTVPWRTFISRLHKIELYLIGQLLALRW